MAIIVLRQSCAYYGSLLSGIHHAYQVRVLLAVETQAGSGCSVPNRTVLYCSDPYRSVETINYELTIIKILAECSIFTHLIHKIISLTTLQEKKEKRSPYHSYVKETEE